MNNLIVAKYLDGSIVRGRSIDFGPEKEMFHLLSEDGRLCPVFLRDLKAAFFVKSLEGREKNENSGDTVKTNKGRKIIVEFRDGERIEGTTFDHRITKNRFFIFPVDDDDNNERILINRLATKHISLEDVPTEDDGTATKALELCMYKLIYCAACELAGLHGKDAAPKTKSIGFDLAHQLNTPVAEYLKKHDDEAWHKFRESKLMEIRMTLGDHVHDQIREIMNGLS